MKFRIVKSYNEIKEQKNIIKIIISVIKAIYIMYMFIYFKTTYNFAHDVTTYFTSDFFKHPIYKIYYPENLVCPFGHMMSVILGIFLIVRSFFIIPIFEIIVLCLTFIISVALNLNTAVYLIPYFIIEIIFWITGINKL